MQSNVRNRWSPRNDAGAAGIGIITQNAQTPTKETHNNDRII
ncbi:hypothetical protein [Paenarthrobacter aromaticivorans]